MKRNINNSKDELPFKKLQTHGNKLALLLCHDEGNIKGENETKLL